MNTLKTLVFLTFAALFLSGCGNAPQPVNNNSASNKNTSVEKPMSSHSTTVNSGSTTQTDTTSTSNQPKQDANSGSPMAKAVDVAEMTANIEKAEKEYKAKPTDAKAKEALAEAYFKRAIALRAAAQYSAALGDFRKGLKLNPNNPEAKGMHDEIVKIYQSMGREVPKEGEEKKPMPIN
jgi:tetratricopeptide (TPR) repeat protein